MADAPTPVGSRRGASFRDMLSLFVPGKLVDLGAGHGGFSIAAANLGWEVTAVDARTERWPSDGRITWVQRDVRDVDLASFDLVACLGLFYHLTNRDQLELIERAAGRPMIIDTHLDEGMHEHNLSERVTSDEGFEGRWYKEPGLTTSSWGNDSSFWPTLPSLHRMLAGRGFPTVLTLEPWIAPDRTFFLAIPDSRRAPVR